MVDAKTIRDVALTLPEVEDSSNGERLSFAVRGKGIAWAYLAREAPKKPRVLVPGVLAIRCTLEDKDFLIETAPEKFFDDDHYKGFPAVLVRLKKIGQRELKGLLVAAWRCQAPAKLIKAFDEKR
jgi:hypothetical protein